MSIALSRVMMPPQLATENDLWSVKDVSPFSSRMSDPGLSMKAFPPPGLPSPPHLHASLNIKCLGPTRPAIKPMGPRPQPPKNSAKLLDLHSGLYPEKCEPSVPMMRPLRKTRGIYGDRPRLPTHRPSRYIPAYKCDGDRFAHLAALQNQNSFAVDQHTVVNLATMGLERFHMINEENEYMDLEEEAEFFRNFDSAAQLPSLPLSRSVVQLSFVTNGLLGALSNFRARFGAGEDLFKGDTKDEESYAEMFVGGGYVDVGDEAYLA
ncbi:hypothetical protein FRC12_013010 [Ceratobasidium sp. 428]|nr:hypothetical protein FRC12_013010 [Ceratobasidium sp. 428]